MDYKKMYLILFDATAKAIDILQQAQQQAEELFMSHDDTPLNLLLSDSNKE